MCAASETTVRTFFLRPCTFAWALQGYRPDTQGAGSVRGAASSVQEACRCLCCLSFETSEG